MISVKRMPVDGYALLMTVFICWEIASRRGWVDPNYLPPVTRILHALYELTSSFEIIGHALVSLKRVLLGYIMGSFIGYVIGFACGYHRQIYRTLEFTLEFLRPMPSAALIPIGILFLGMGDALNAAIIGWACAWPTFVNTMDGVRSVDGLLKNTARTLGMGRARIIRRVVIPAAMPHVFTGLRIGLGIAVAVVVITEMAASADGLGAFIFNASISYRVPEMFAGIIVVGIFGYALNVLFLTAEKRVLKWRRGGDRGSV